MRVSVIVAAAGQGKRFGAKHNKIFAKIGGRPVFLRTLELFANRDDVCQIILVVNADDVDEIKDRFGGNLGFMSVKIVTGGAERTDSIRNALAQVDAEADLVAVHDAVRPCVSALWIDDVFAEADRTGAAILAYPLCGTLKRVSKTTREPESGKQVMLGGEVVPGMSPATRKAWVIEETVPRVGLWEAQTPQVFRRDLLIDAYAKAEGSATDDAGIVEATGVAVSVVPGDARNVKITTRKDLATASAVIGSLPKPKRSVEAHPFGEAKW